MNPQPFDTIWIVDTLTILKFYKFYNNYKSRLTDNSVLYPNFFNSLLKKHPEFKKMLDKIVKLYLLKKL